MRSLLDRGCLPAPQVYVLDCGIRRRTRARLEASWPELRVAWIPLAAARLAGLPISGHASRANYGRMLLPDVLPPDLADVLYLDSDVIVRDDLRPLWAEPLHGAAVLAVKDAGAPYVHCDDVPDFERVRPHVRIPDPIRNHAALGIPGATPYFNSGVLRIDLARWRAEQVPAQLLACLRANHAHVRLWDQYALNVVLHGRWRELPPRWNAQVFLQRYPSAAESPYDADVLADALRRPAIVHYADAIKPWHHGYPHAWGEHMFAALDRTAWAGWRPARPVLGVDWPRAYRRLRKRLRKLRRRLPGAS